MSEKTVSVVEVTDSNIDKFVILREGEVDGGFQRKFSKKKADEMLSKFTNGSFVPPIMVADIKGKLVVMDGQHRLILRKTSKFPLYAQINKAEDKQAVENFVDCNSKGARVTLAHRLRVDPRPIPAAIRALAKQYSTTNKTVYHLFCGAARNRVLVDATVVDGIEMRLVREILRDWTDDKRWGDASEYFDTPGVLHAVGNLMRNQPDPRKCIKKLKDLKYSIGSPLASLYGGNSREVRMMSDYMSREAGIKIISDNEVDS